METPQSTVSLNSRPLRAGNGWGKRENESKATRLCVKAKQLFAKSIEKSEYEI
jgi:hypothetical protein